MIALIVGAAACGGEAMADDNTVREISHGKNGAAWYWQSRPGGGREAIFPTAGEHAPDVELSNPVSNLTTPAKTTAVEVGSVGGNGQIGDGYTAGGISGSTFYSLPGTDGGNGGNVYLEQTGELAGFGSQASDKALLSIYSIGGYGGISHSQDRIESGRGGAAGTVTLDMQADMRVVGNHFAGIWAKSEAGQTGRNYTGTPIEGGVPAVNVGKYPGVNGNTVSVVVGAQVTISTQEDTAERDPTKRGYAPAVIAESIGGAGIDGATIRSLLPGAGNGGTVTFENHGHIMTDGNVSTGVLLQSVGGRGGRQMKSVSHGNTSTSAGGGSGGHAGHGGEVKALQAGTIETMQDYSFGIAAFSIGGGGGSGASGFGGVQGGDGGNAGNGGTVDVINSGLITTHGKGSVGLSAQSLGGGGALNAFQRASLTPGSSTGGGTAGGGYAAFFGAGTGGRGGAGGDGGIVSVTNDGTIETGGESAFGILAQSVGGGGGSGGRSSTAFSILLGSATGGDGGGGGHGGVVKVNPSDIPEDADAPFIKTTGNLASAILAQSVGGGGGAGGDAKAVSTGVIAAISIAVGGAGGKGGDGGSVYVDNTSVIETAGKEAHGIEARSVGGGGGKAGNASAYAIGVAPPPYPSLSLTWAVGGSGGEGGAGGTVSVANLSRITTIGEKAYGVFATSIGGGGGNAGSASAVSDVIGFTRNFAFGVSIGGSSDGGGNADLVNVLNANAIETQGKFATGILAASIGGGGGDGGVGTASASKGVSNMSYLSTIVEDGMPIADAWTAKVAIGGSGGKGGSGGQVIVDNYGSIVTRNDQSKAIIAQSIGGGGGTGGGYLSMGSSERTGSLNIGGSGGEGGAGGAVNVGNADDAVIATFGDGSAAIFAQSVGGGGGDGGALAGSTKAAPSLKNAVKATDAVFQLTDDLFKINKRIVDQFGNPALAREEASFFDKKSSAQEKLKSAKTVFSIVKAGWASVKDSIKQNEKIREQNIINAKEGKPLIPEIPVGETIGKAVYESAKSGALSYVIKELSDKLKDGLTALTGKIDNTKATVAVNVSIGGTGGKGGDGGPVTIDNRGGIQTHGAISYGIFAQSIGGGGGSGGGAVTSGANWYNVDVSIGGNGSQGGVGGTVNVTNDGVIETLGRGSFGILAQSIGGGGGLGGAAVNADAVTAVSATFNVGGKNEVFASGGRVEITNAGTIRTSGKEAHAIAAQSIGGGGGAFFIDRGSLVSADALADSQEALEALREANELLKELDLGTIGDDGSHGGKAGPEIGTVIPPISISANIGGRARSNDAAGKNGGDGGSVKVVHAGAIETSGLGAIGILAQSIGGGGGFSADTTALGSASFKTVLGGTGGTSGNGGHVDIVFDKSASIRTSGDGAIGVLAQSIGGGGGYTGTGAGAFQLATPREWQSWNSIPGFIAPGFSGGYWMTHHDGATGNGSTINIGMSGPDARIDIATTGERAHGIFAQSIGGGGGYGFDVNGGNVPYNSSAASRDASMRGFGGVVNIDTRGDIVASGRDSYGIFAQSGVQKVDGSIDLARITGGYNRIVHAGRIEGGSGEGAAIRVDGGTETTIRLLPGSHVSAQSNMAIIGSTGKYTIDNHGKLVGGIRFSGNPSASLFHNHREGVYESRGQSEWIFYNGGVGLNEEINLGENGIFRNEGTLDIAGEGAIGRLTINKGAKIELGGVMLVDIDRPAREYKVFADNVSGGRVEIRDVVIQPRIGQNLNKGRIFVISGDTISNQNAVRVVNTEGSPVSWGHTSDNTTVWIEPTADFVGAVSGPVTTSEMALLQALQRAWDAQSSPETRIFASLAKAGSAADYLEIVDRISPEEKQHPAVLQALNARGSLSHALSCPVFADTGTIINESQCVWGSVTGSRTMRFESRDNNGYRNDALSYRVGGQWEIAPDWFLGATAAYNTDWLQSRDRGTRADGKGADVSIALKHQIGAWYFAGAVHAGYHGSDFTQSFMVGDEWWSSKIDTKTWTFGLRGRAAYEFAFDEWYVRPYVDVDAIHAYMPGYIASGSGPARRVDPMREWTFAVSPAVELGVRKNLESGGWLRPYVSVGGTYFKDHGLSTKVRFVDGVEEGIAFESTSHLPRYVFDVGAGVQFLSKDSFEVRGEYKAQIGKDFLNQKASLRAAIHF
ncbi:autotransporter outer membrane beta-barrel domain-containing protein [Pseudochelatococcus sp. B33]